MEDITITIGSDGVISYHGNVPFSCKEKEDSLGSWVRVNGL